MFPDFTVVQAIQEQRMNITQVTSKEIAQPHICKHIFQELIFADETIRNMVDVCVLQVQVFVQAVPDVHIVEIIPQQCPQTRNAISQHRTNFQP